MPTLKVTVRKRTEDPWILSIGQPVSNAYFTEQEINDTVLPYWQSVQQLSGLIDISVIDINSDLREVSYKFDTMQSLIDSKAVMVDSQLANTRIQLMQVVMTRNNFQTYNVSSEIILDEAPIQP